MRVKDDEKINKIYRAAIKVVNRNGFEGSSMLKIAAEADVSAATIYLYFENKDDMIKKLFIHLKSRMGNSYYNDNNELTPSKGTYRALWLNHYQFIMENIEEFNFLENFTNCPLINKIENDNKNDLIELNNKLEERKRESNESRISLEQLRILTYQLLEQEKKT